MQFSSSSVGEQRNRSSALRQNALSLACTDILETVEVGFVPDFFSFYLYFLIVNFVLVSGNQK